MYCAKCGRVVTQRAKFCANCGAPVGAPAEGQAPAEPAQPRQPSYGEQVVSETADRVKSEISWSISSAIGRIVGDLIRAIFRR